MEGNRELYRTKLFRDNYDGSIKEVSVLTMANSVDEANSIAETLAYMHHIIDTTTNDACHDRIVISYN